MASVKSLGVHLPSGLHYAVESDILPSEPPASSYTWEYFVDSSNGQGCEDELLTTKECVVWSRGGSMRRIFSFNLENEPVTQALMAYFPTSEDSDEATTTKEPQRTTGNRSRGLSRALVVFLKTQAHIHLLSGTSYVVHMPFEVESACAAPCGVIIQRKLKADNLAPVSLKFPRVPPNSFVSSQPFIAPRHSSTHNMTFSTEGLGKPKTLPLRLSSTLENMWQPTLESTDSHWPRLVCLTDPLQELGLVVTHLDKPALSKARRSSIRSPFLDPAEEILHIEAITLPSGEKSSSKDPTVIAVTVNRTSSMYSVWRMDYIDNEDMFTERHKNAAKRESTRRRSSMPPGLASGAATPIQSKMRESFGATLPGKKPRRNDKSERTLDTALSSLDPEKGVEATRRQSRRVSSLLARADLSASQDRSAFAEQALVPGHVGRRVDSHGSHRARNSANFGGMSFSGTFNQNLNSLAEAPVDNLLDELRAGGDFEGFHTMGLDDHDFDGLAREIILTKVHSVPMDNANVRYSLSKQPARTQCRVFVLTGPPPATDEQGRSQLVVGIQDPVDKRLQLLLFHIHKGEVDTTPGRAGQKQRTTPTSPHTITWGHLRKAQGVVDSCKVSDGDQSVILILSEDKSGQRELSLQAPWSQLTTVALPVLFREDLDSLDFVGEYADEDANSRRIVGFGGSGIQIIGLANPQLCGIVDIRDRDGAFHRIRVQLQPTSTHVRRVLDACRSVLPASQAEKMLSTWWHIMQWRACTGARPDDLEWSSLVILLFSTFLALGHSSETDSSRDALTLKHTPSSPFRLMQAHSTPVSAACPPWMHTMGWQWLLEDDVVEVTNPAGSGLSGGQFASLHVALAKKFLSTPRGLSAFGPQGTLPTSSARSAGTRKTAAWSIMMALHLLLEEQRLNILTSEDVPQNDTYLIVVLAQIARWLGWKEYASLYDLGMQTDVPLSSKALIQDISPIMEPPSTYSVYDWVQSHLTSDKAIPFLSLADIYTTSTQDTATENARTRLWNSVTPRTFMFTRLFQLLKSVKSGREMVEAMHECDFTPHVLETLPEAILTPLQDAIFMCQPDPPSSWSSSLLELVNRTDVNSIFKSPSHVRTGNVLALAHQASWDVQLLCQSVDDLSNTGHDEGEATERQAVVRALFKEDRRLNEAQNLLSSQKPRVVRLDPQPGWSDSDYLERQRELATTVATGTLAIPAGRGMLYYSLRYPILTQRFLIGGFNLSCIVKPNNAMVGIDKSSYTEEKICWAFFHQGVAGGLAISPHAKGIDTSWILYNKIDLSNRHAGFLLALGLNGHLKSVAKWVAFKYLTPKHTMTSIGLLLGLAASYIGTMDSLITRLLSVHVTRMLPRGAAELNLSKHTQTTGIMGIGLLYCNSQHRRMSEVMLSEIEHVEDEEEENPLRDEGYRLAAGFALGFINLGKGADLKGLYDMRLTEKLLTVATVTKNVELVHVLDRSAAGAVMAIALIFMKSDDHIVARKIDVPESVLQFDYIRPDILLLRTLAKNLIMWSKIEPRFEWIKASLPREYRWRHNLKNVTKLQTKDLPFFSILAGTCFAIALRYAGSANPKVRDVLVHYLDELIRIVRLPCTKFDAELARGNVRMCMDLLALSCATVMAGSGDLIVLRRLRSLHGRDDTSTTYGSHLAAHLAIGALFLGCGTATFGTSNLAIASLLVAFYPLFPANVQDNSSHLQAFRHFWVLATEPRCLVTKDVSSGQPVSVPILIFLKPYSATATSLGPASSTASILRRQTPCLLPPLHDVASVRTDASALGYWDIAIDFASRPDLASAFQQNQSLYLRRRPAHEGPFSATVRALGKRGNIPLAEGQVEPVVRDPLEWLFGLDALRVLTHAERAIVLDLAGGGDGVGEGEGATTAVDTRLALQDGLDGRSRDRLLGLRLLFAWADRRGLLRRPGGQNVGDEKEMKKDKGKSTRVERKGRKKVEVVTEPRDAAGEGDEAVARSLGEGDTWWMRDSVIDLLKGQAWLAGRGE